MTQEGGQLSNRFHKERSRADAHDGERSMVPGIRSAHGADGARMRARDHLHLRERNADCLLRMTAGVSPAPGPALLTCRVYPAYYSPGDARAAIGTSNPLAHAILPGTQMLPMQSAASRTGYAGCADAAGSDSKAAKQQWAALAAAALSPVVPGLPDDCPGHLAIQWWPWRLPALRPPFLAGPALGSSNCSHAAFFG